MVRIDFNEVVGKIKPMNGVNNGPTPPSVRGLSDFELYKAANIPFARLHDSAFSTYYGWEFSVDVHRIFRNFDADETDPASYDFEETDKYIKTILDAGTQVTYKGEADGWVNIDYNGEDAYIKSDFVQPVAAETPAAETPAA